LSVLDTPVAVLVTLKVIAEAAPFQNVTVVVTALPFTAVTKASAPKALVVVAPLYVTSHASPTENPGALKLNDVLVAEVAFVMAPRLNAVAGYASVAV
jgi:hypothetical protein